MTDRYQSGLGVQGTFDTPAWFAALREGIDGPLGSVLDVGCAEGVMCALALQDGAEFATGIDYNADRIATARLSVPRGAFYEMDATETGGINWLGPDPRRTTVIMSQIIHWLGPDVSARYFRAATRNLAIVFRLANDHYEIPAHGTWFPTFAELDAAVGHPRTSETLLLTQDNGKEIWAATYRTDLTIEDGYVLKNGRKDPLREGIDLHGDPPFRLRPHDQVIRLSGPNASAVRELARKVAQDSLADGTYPSDFSPRNVIVNGGEAWLIDDEPDERAAGTHVAPEYLPIWQATLSSIGLSFDGDLRSLL